MHCKVAAPETAYMCARVLVERSATMGHPVFPFPVYTTDQYFYFQAAMQKGASWLFRVSVSPPLSVRPRLRLSPNVEPSSTVVSLEWLDVQPAVGTKVSDYILHHKKVDEYTNTDLYTGQ